MTYDSTLDNSRFLKPSFGVHIAFWAAAPKGTMSCQTQGAFLSLSVFLPVYLFVHKFVLPFKPQVSLASNQASQYSNQVSQASNQPSKSINQTSQAFY